MSMTGRTLGNADDLMQGTDPGAASGNAEKVERHHRRHRRRQARDELRAEIEKLTFQRRALSLATGVLMVAVLVLGSTTVHYQASFESTRQAALASQRDNTARIRGFQEFLLSVHASLLEAREGLKVLVAGRVPGLHALAFGEALPVGEDYVRDITFNKVAGGLEYKVVLENDSPSPVKPALSVLLFDKFGVELARSEIGGIHTRKGDDTLRAGEIRSHFSALKIPHEPEYFRVVGDGSKPANAPTG